MGFVLCRTFPQIAKHLEPLVLANTTKVIPKSHLVRLSLVSLVRICFSDQEEQRPYRVAETS